jgi:hypothetical protein
MDQATRKTVVIVGSGSLAHSICYSLASIVRDPCRIVLCARSRQKCDEIQYVAGGKAFLLGSAVEFGTFLFDLETGDAQELIAQLEPDLLLNCASYHSPWESRYRPSPWTELVAGAGFGITLPLQAAFAIKLARAVAESPKPIVFINGCYPDAVNPILRALNLPVFCGIGNVALVAASLQSALGLIDRRRLRVLAHHLHLNPLKPDAEEALAWIDDVRLWDVGSLLAQQRATEGLEVNKLIGFSAALLVKDILNGKPAETCVPGPYGLPGGYPVIVHGANLRLNLPHDVSEAEAIAWNQRWAVCDGVRLLASGDVEFSTKVENALTQHLPQLACGFHVSQTAEVIRALLELRHRLRHAPSERIMTAGLPH